MASIRTRILEVSIVSGEDICSADRNLVSTDMNVVVRAESIKCWRTKMAKQGAESRSTLWNDKLKVEMPWHAKSITLEVQSKTAKGVIRSIGLARIAIGEVLRKEEVLSYRLRNWEGRRSGIINFSVKVVNNKETQQEEEDDDDEGTTASSCGLKFRDHCGTVTGIPVSWIHPGIIAV